MWIYTVEIREDEELNLNLKLIVKLELELEVEKQLRRCILTEEVVYSSLEQLIVPLVR